MAQNKRVLSTTQNDEDVVRVWANGSEESSMLLADLRRSGLIVNANYAVEVTPVARFRDVLYLRYEDIRTALTNER